MIRLLMLSAYYFVPHEVIKLLSRERINIKIILSTNSYLQQFRLRLESGTVHLYPNQRYFGKKIHLKISLSLKCYNDLINHGLFLNILSCHIFKDFITP